MDFIISWSGILLIRPRPGWQADSKGVGEKDLYAAFLMRGLELARPYGMSAMLTMRGWMFLSQFQGSESAS